MGEAVPLIMAQSWMQHSQKTIKKFKKPHFEQLVYTTLSIQKVCRRRDEYPLEISTFINGMYIIFGPYNWSSN